MHNIYQHSTNNLSNQNMQKKDHDSDYTGAQKAFTLCGGARKDSEKSSERKMKHQPLNMCKYTMSQHSLH